MKTNLCPLCGFTSTLVHSFDFDLDIYHCDECNCEFEIGNTLLPNKVLSTTITDEATQ